MNPRTPLMLSSREGESSIGGGLGTTVSQAHSVDSPGKSHGSKLRAPTTSVPLVPSTRTLRNSTTRPTRVNTAVNASPRKASAPSKLISILGGSLENLPNTVSVRRKTSAPAKALISSTNTKKTSAKTTTRSRRTSTSSGSGATCRISKDHGGAGSQQGSKGTATNAAGDKAKDQHKGVSKKSSSSSVSSDMQTLPTLKEEKKQQSSSKANRKMEGKGSNKENMALPTPATRTMVPSPPLPTQPPDLAHPHLQPTSPTSPTFSTSSASSFPEKAQLEKTVSDLVKNAESKKQEIAALKMEINRLKESAREREHLSDEENIKGAMEGGTCTVATGHPSAPTTTTTHELPANVRNTMQTLAAENKLLRERLLQLGVSLDSAPLSDQEKEILLTKNGGEGPALCAEQGEWDNKSTSSVSEMSVACLQDRIQQMEETHYCTNEELQATLQELDDLREQLSESHLEVQQLQEEKQVILESLTQQTEKLNEARSHNDTLKHMLIQQSENSQDLSQCEKTQRLMELLKSAQEDRELLQMKQEEVEQQLATTKEAEERYHRDSQLIRDRMKLLESMLEAANSEKKAAESQLTEALETTKATEIETTRLQTALDTAKDKITELEAAVISGEKSKLPDVLERVRQEKDALEKENASHQQKANAMACENERLKDQISSLQDEIMVARNNARSQLEDADWKKTRLEEEQRHLQEEMDVLRATVEDLKLACQHHLEDKRDLKANLSEAQKKLNEANEKLSEKDRCINEEKAHFNKQVEEWEQFQSDLLMTVRVANDFKTEAQHDLERLTQENAMLRDRLKQLGQDLEKAKAVKVCSPVSNSSNTTLNNGSSERRTVRAVPASLPNGDPNILADRRNPRPLSRGDSRVKSLIESIESATRQTRAGSRSSSTSSLCSTSSESNINNKTTAPILKRADTETVIRGGSSSPLKDAGNTLGTSSVSSPLRAIQRNSFTDGISQSSITQSTFSKPGPGSSNLSDNVKMSQLSDKNSGKISSLGSGDNVSKPISILSNKIDHTMRRNSYGQISAVVDKKDPLASLAQSGGSKRNALLKWCQSKTLGYNNVDITNFSSSWNDGLALCAILDTYLSEKINYKYLSPQNKRQNFQVAISAAESVGIPNLLDVNDMITSERPNWQTVYNYVTSIYCHFET
ncbi:cytospin-A isoform X15 [Procambarus clarkii]|uniref:cytospin-A isoform X15 n=1 Tax=Procambarus clarkii TaxID=6728 RepID=UPI003743BAAB